VSKGVNCAKTRGGLAGDLLLGLRTSGPWVARPIAGKNHHDGWSAVEGWWGSGKVLSSRGIYLPERVIDIGKPGLCLRYVDILTILSAERRSIDSHIRFAYKCLPQGN
jgi:hypothetical protein